MFRPVSSLVLCAVLSATSCGGSADPAEALRSAREALEAGDAETARDQLSALLDELDPESKDHARAGLDLLRARLDLGEPELAIAFLELASSHRYGVRPGDFRAFADRLAQAGRGEEAIGLLDAGWREYPDDPAWLDGIELVRSHAEGWPSEPRIRWLLGNVLLERFHRSRDVVALREALDDFLTSLELKPGGEDEVVLSGDDRLQANLGQGWCYFWLGVVSDGDFETSQRVFEQILERFAGNTQAEVGLGLSLMYQDRLDEARGVFELATRGDENSTEAWFNLGQVQLKLGEWTEAEAAFEQVLALDPAHVPARVWLATALGEQGDRTRPRKLLGEALVLEPENLDAMVQLGTIHALEARFDEAAIWFDRALQIDSQNANAYLQRSKVSIARGDHHRAMADLHKACELRPESFEAHYNLGVLLSNYGSPIPAIQLLRRAVELAPDRDQAKKIEDAILSLEARAMTEQMQNEEG